jgi:hypothetical protein
MLMPRWSISAGSKQRRPSSRGGSIWSPYKEGEFVLADAVSVECLDRGEVFIAFTAKVHEIPCSHLRDDGGNQGVIQRPQ